VPVSGQDGDHAALNRIALGTQTVSVWKDSRELGKHAATIAALLADGKKMSEVPNVTKWADGPNKIEMNAIFLPPVAITKENLNVVIDAGWVKKDVVCQGVKGDLAVCK
jgi:D-xylose transport system substrate-binding protein